MDFDNVMLFLIGLFSVRDLISKNVNIPINPRLSWILYNKNEFEKIPYCYQLNKINKNKPPIEYNSDIILKLVLVLGEHTKYFMDGVYCDKKEKIRINHMVNTLIASHDSNNLKIMVDILDRLFCGISVEMNIDFVISLKGGNVLLVNELVQRYNRELIHITYNRNLFFESLGITSSNSLDVETGMELKFENINELIRISKLNRRKLNGVILDCSYSSGDGIIQCVKDFKEIISKNSNASNINLIKEVRVLYSHVGTDISEKLNEYNCNIKYLFSLNDEIRKMLYEMIYKEEHSDIKLKNAHTILEKLKKNNLFNNSTIV